MAHDPHAGIDLAQCFSGGCLPRAWWSHQQHVVGLLLPAACSILCVGAKANGVTSVSRVQSTFQSLLLRCSVEAQRACPVPPAIVGRFHSRGDNKPVAPTTTRWAPLTQCRSAYTAVVPFGPGVDGDRASNVDGDRPDHPGGAGQRADRPVGDAPAHTSSAHTKRLLFSRQIVDQHSYVVIGASRIPDEKPFEAKLRCGLMDSEFMARYPREPQQGA